MNAATMRQRFRDRVAGLADGLTDAQVDVYLNQVYQSTIPNKVDGMLSDGRWTVDTEAEENAYQLPAYVHSPRGLVRVDGTDIDTHTREDQVPTSYRQEMWADYASGTTTEGEPTVALIYGGGDSTEGTHAVLVYPTPMAVYTLSGAARVYPTDPIAAKTNGMDDTHALAVLAGAAHEFALDNSLDEVAPREGERFASLISQLRFRSDAPAEETKHRRTF